MTNKILLSLGLSAIYLNAIANPAMASFANKSNLKHGNYITSSCRQISNSDGIKAYQISKAFRIEDKYKFTSDRKKYWLNVATDIRGIPIICLTQESDRLPKELRYEEKINQNYLVSTKRFHGSKTAFLITTQSKDSSPVIISEYMLELKNIDKPVLALIVTPFDS
jgi:hypothetical protein